MIVDLDAHQGNGHERDFINDEQVCIIDAYNPNIYPGDYEAAKAIKHKINVYKKDTDKSYLEKLAEVIDPAIEEFKPELIIYNAGSDCMINDPLGGLKITP
jgi:histone deacetylase 11